MPRATSVPSPTPLAGFARTVLHLLMPLLALLLAPHAHAQEDPPGRVGRIAEINGSVSWYDAEQNRWDAAQRNYPLTSGDRISTALDGRAELRIGSTTLRLSNDSELELRRIDDEHLVFLLHSGSLALRVRSREVAGEIEVDTEEARLLPQRAGHYRIDRIDDVTLAGSWRGELRVADQAGGIVGTGQRVELRREGGSRTLVLRSDTLPLDGFNAWAVGEDQREERLAAPTQRYVSPEMTGAEDLDAYGRWDTHPDYGPVWLPLQVAPGWAPYRYGRWSWVAPWGWTWIDDAPWGFAPFHYGRWVFWRDAWFWAPGTYVPRPVYAPALVAWGSGAGGSVRWGISAPGALAGPGVSWLPLAPREVFQPWYRATPRYVGRINPGAPGQAPRGPGEFRNHGAPNAVGMLPGEPFGRRPAPRADGAPRNVPPPPWRDRDGGNHAGSRSPLTPAPTMQPPRPAPVVQPPAAQPGPTSPPPTRVLPPNPAAPPGGHANDRWRDRSERADRNDGDGRRFQPRRGDTAQDDGRGRTAQPQPQPQPRQPQPNVQPAPQPQPEARRAPEPRAQQPARDEERKHRPAPPQRGGERDGTR